MCVYIFSYMLFVFVSSINNIYVYMNEYYANSIALKRPRYALLTRPPITSHIGQVVAKMIIIIWWQNVIDTNPLKK